MSSKDSKLSHFFSIITLAMLCAFAPMCSDLYLPSLPSIMLNYDTNPSLIQLSLTVSFLGLALGQLIIGPLSDTYGRIRPLMVSLFIFIICSFLCAIDTCIEFFVLLRFLQGLAASGGIVLSRSIACDLFSGHKLTSFMAFLMAINSLAPILAPIIGSFIITVAPWQMIFYILSLWGLLLIILSRFSLHETLEIDKRAKNVKYSLLLLKTEIYNRSFMLCSLSLSAIMGGFFSYLAASPFIFQSIYGLTAFEYSLTFAFISVCISATGMLAGRLCRKFSEFKILRIALIVMLVTAFMIMFEALWLPKSFVVVMLTLALFCALMALSQSSGFGIVMGLRRGGAGAASGLFGVLSFLLGSLISPFVGILGEKSMLPLGIIMITCVIMAIVLLKSALKGVNTDKL